jgi:uncharacterized protein (TIGR03790 family)
LNSRPPFVVWFSLLVQLLSVGPFPAQAGGSGLNVIVVANGASADSLRLANAYCELRGVPPENFLRIDDWAGGNTLWTRVEFENHLLQPLRAMVAGRGLSNQAWYVLLSMGFPYRIIDTDGVNSTTSVLFYGFKTNAPPPPGLPGSCSLPDASSNSYCFSELPFRSARPNTATGPSFLTMMLTDTTIDRAETMLRRAVAGDGTFPDAAVVLEKTTDSARNVRYFAFDNAVFNSRLFGNGTVMRKDSNETGFTNLFGLQTGLANETFHTNAFLPGAIADTLTSFAGDLFEAIGQTPLLAFLDAGAAGSYGAVEEPCNYTQKFPDPMDYIYQHRGFSLAESYYQSVLNPYQGLFVGEPLAAPFAKKGTAEWNVPTNGAVLSGVADLDVTFQAATTNLPLAEADLYVDGVFDRRLTSLGPTAGATFSATVNGITVNHTVASNSTISSIAKSWADAMNTQSNATRVIAHPAGDRIELQSLLTGTPGSNVTLAASGDGALPSRVYPASQVFLDSIATGYRDLFITNAPVVGDWLRLDVVKTNGMEFHFAATNTVLGTTTGALFQQVLAQVEATPALGGPDGIHTDVSFDYAGDGLAAAEAVLAANSAGWPAAQISLSLSSSSNLVVTSTGATHMDDNVSDLRPRNCLFLTAGATTLPVRSTIDTTALADGYHEIEIVARQGDSVETQTRAFRRVRVANTGLSAVFTSNVGETNSSLLRELQFSVYATGRSIAQIDLHTTGGLIRRATNQNAAVFTVPGAVLGIGLHPFFALVTAEDGSQYRTETLSVRLTALEPDFPITISGTPPELHWPAIPGETYQILGAPIPTATFSPVTNLVASNSSGRWPLPPGFGNAMFYIIRSSP